MKIVGKLGFVALTISVTFLWPHKKVTKEGGTGEALKVALPRAPYGFLWSDCHRQSIDSIRCATHRPSPMNPTRPHLGSWEELNLDPEHSKNVPIFAALYRAEENRQGGESGAPAISKKRFSEISGR